MEFCAAAVGPVAAALPHADNDAVRTALEKHIRSALHIGVAGDLAAGHSRELQHIGLQAVELSGKRGKTAGVRCGNRVGKDRHARESVGGDPFQSLRRQAGVADDRVRFPQRILLLFQPVGGDVLQNAHIGHADEHVALGVDERHIAGAAAVRAAQHVRHIHADRLAGGEDLAAI